MNKRSVEKELFYDRCCKCGRPVHWSEVREDDKGNVYCPDCAPSNANWVREGPGHTFKVRKEDLKIFCEDCKEEVYLQILDIYEEKNGEIVFLARCPKCFAAYLLPAKKLEG